MSEKSPTLNDPEEMLEAELLLASKGCKTVLGHYMRLSPTHGVECSSMAQERAAAIREKRETQAPSKPGKRPIGKWKVLATSDPKKIRQRRTGWKRFANTLIATGEVSSLFVIDCDGEEGVQSFKKHAESRGGLPSTWTAQSGSGDGLHFYFEWPKGKKIKNSASMFLPKVDVRGDGGAIIVPPSTHPSGNKYVWLEGCSPSDLELATPPDWLVSDLSGQSRTTAQSRRLDSTQTEQKMHGRSGKGIKSLLGDIGDGSGQGGFNGPIYAAMCAFFRENGCHAPAKEIVGMVREIVASACRKQGRGTSTKYDNDAYLFVQAESARQFVAKNAPASASTETKFRCLEDGIAALNKLAAAVLAGSTFRIIIDRDTEPAFLSVRDATNLFAPYKYLDEVKEGRERWKPLFPQWLEHSKRNQYRGITFAPGGNAGDAFNLWRGLQVEPRRELSWLKMQKHLFEGLCECDPDLFIYLMSWFAQTIQQPEVKPGTALVIKGQKGTGKSSIVDTLKAILGRHLKTVSDSKALLGNFNSHLAEALVVVSEEAIWAGSHAIDGPLKHKITAPTMLLEKKGVDKIEIRDFARLIFISNDERIVPATSDERRFLGLRMALIYRGNRSHFEELYAELEAGGASAMLFDLQTFDYRQVNLRQPPMTPLLRQQIESHLSHKDRWLLGVLHEGDFAVPDGQSCQECQDWESSAILVPRAIVFESFNASVRGSQLASPRDIGSFLKSRLTGIEDVRPQKNGQRQRLYRFPSLPELRREFARRCNVDIDADVPSPPSDAFWTRLEPPIDNNDPFYLAGRDMMIRATLDYVFQRPGED